MKKVLLFLGFGLFFGPANAQSTDPCKVAREVMFQLDDYKTTEVQDVEKALKAAGSISSTTKRALVNSYVRYAGMYIPLLSQLQNSLALSSEQMKELNSALFPWRSVSQFGISRSYTNFSYENFDLFSHGKILSDNIVKLMNQSFDKSGDLFWVRVEEFWVWFSDAKKSVEVTEAVVSKEYASNNKYMLLQAMDDEKAAHLSAKETQRQLTEIGQLVTEQIVKLKSCK